VELTGKTAFVTGAARGIGQAIACAFARAGANVMIITDKDEDGLARTERRVRELGGSVASMRCDVASASQVLEAVNATVERFGGLDCAVNNAAFFPRQAELTAVDEDLARRVMEVDYWGVFHCMRAQIPAMLRRGGGSVVNIASGAGLLGFPLSSTYCAAKRAVIGLTRAAALDYAPRGVRINAVCPGMVRTPALEPHLANADFRAAAIAMHPIGRVAEASEIAEAVVWLSSPRSSFVVGACIPVDGGYTAR
jgi:NAD(P)-dependent dehydrogenase (short-subunit alcohol dehydrogenase family)